MERAERRSTGREGAVPSIIVIGVLLYAANVWPGWWSVPFVTPQGSEVIGAVNAAWIAGLVANAVYLVAGTPALRAVGEIVVLIFGIVATVRVWEVFPFVFPGGPPDWAVLVRVLLVIGIVGALVGILAQLVAFVRAVMHLGRRPGPGRQPGPRWHV